MFRTSGFSYRPDRIPFRLPLRLWHNIFDIQREHNDMVSFLRKGINEPVDTNIRCHLMETILVLVGGKRRNAHYGFFVFSLLMP